MATVHLHFGAAPQAPKRRAGAGGFQGRTTGGPARLGVPGAAPGGHPPLGPHPGAPRPGAAPGGHPGHPGLGAPPATAPRPGGAAPAPGGPVPSLSPPDSTYNQQIAAINRTSSNRLTDLQGQQTAIERDFGLTDPTNPFNRAEALKRSYLQNLRGTSASLANQGHLYSGEHERALSRVRFNQERDYAALRQAYEAALGQVTSARAGTQTQSEEQRAAAFADWLSRAPTDNALPTEAPGATPQPGGGQGYGGPGTTLAPSTLVPAPRPTGGTPVSSLPQAIAKMQAAAPKPGSAPVGKQGALAAKGQQLARARSQQRRGRERGRVAGRRAIL